ncbi:MAG: uroporphyrinogen-III synthase [Bryobacteraceae bacterium]
MSFAGKRVLSLESRRAPETAELIRRHNGVPISAPSMREVPIEQNESAFHFAQQLMAGDFDMVIFLTGVGTRFLAKLLSTRYPLETFAEALRTLTVVARGPKPSAALRELGVPVTIQVPEPNTWHEILAATEGRPERRIAVQEYGKPSIELHEGLRAGGAEVTAVTVYQWDLPEDVEPLREAARLLAARDVDVSMFTTSTQVVHLLRIAAELGIEAETSAGLSQTLIVSIGPTTTEMLKEYGFTADMEPSHPRLGLLVKEAAEQANDLLARKTLR